MLFKIIITLALVLINYNTEKVADASCCCCCPCCCKCCCCPQPPIIIQPPPALHKICQVPCCCCKPCCGCGCCGCGCCGGGGGRKRRSVAAALRGVLSAPVGQTMKVPSKSGCEAVASTRCARNCLPAEPATGAATKKPSALPRLARQS
ncbi:hypothetical protein GPALN_013081 [Globodera pallida]|nr:hypothetical protein GPALN_013081 [Globodera pallida]